jgi:Pentapeptide repeats (8 copies).
MTNHEFSIPNSEDISPVHIHAKADLSGADLTTAMLRGADLSNADLEDEYDVQLVTDADERRLKSGQKTPLRGGDGLEPYTDRSGAIRRTQ